jgi:cysteine synthase B
MTYTDPLKGSDGAREVVLEVVSKDPAQYFFPDQYSNDSNWLAHYETTGPEIWEQTQGRITHFIAGTGTSGTLMGVGRFLKEKRKNIKIIAIQPEPFHGIEGLKHMESAMPVALYDPSVHDFKITVMTETAYEWTRQLALKEGLLVGPSSGAALFGALQRIKPLKQGVVVIMFPDGGDKYLSTDFWEDEESRKDTRQVA